MRPRVALLAVLASAGPTFFATTALAGSHTWDVSEVFSNADGTIQFIELHEVNGTPGETGLKGHTIVANPTGTTYVIQNNVASPTTFKYYLFATAGFAALPGAPTPNEIIPDNFLNTAVDNRVDYIPWDNMRWTLGALPTDGVNSLHRTGLGNTSVAPGINSPTNYAGQTGTIDASPALPGVPDGTTGTPVLVGKLAADGSSLSVSWDTTTCSGAGDHHILFGERSDFPAAPGGTYSLAGAECSIGAASPFVWSPTPDAADGSGLIWWLIVATDEAVEGPWGKHDGVNERNGPGPNGSSGQCGVTDKETNGTCGH